MALNGIDVLVVVVVVAVGGALTYISLLRAFRRSVTELRLETERQLNAFSQALNSLQLQAVQRPLAVQPGAAPVAAPPAKVEATAPAARAVLPLAEEISPEILVVMAAAVTAFLGKKVRIRSAQMLQSPYEIVNPWSQQGRVIVQASHNLRPR